MIRLCVRRSSKSENAGNALESVSTTNATADAGGPNKVNTAKPKQVNTSKPKQVNMTSVDRVEPESRSPEAKHVGAWTLYLCKRQDLRLIWLELSSINESLFCDLFYWTKAYLCCWQLFDSYWQVPNSNSSNSLRFNPVDPYCNIVGWECVVSVVVLLSGGS